MPISGERCKRGPQVQVKWRQLYRRKTQGCVKGSRLRIRSRLPALESLALGPQSTLACGITAHDAARAQHLFPRLAGSDLSVFRVFSSLVSSSILSDALPGLWFFGEGHIVLTAPGCAHSAVLTAPRWHSSALKSSPLPCTLSRGRR